MVAGKFYRFIDHDLSDIEQGWLLPTSDDLSRVCWKLHHPKAGDVYPFKKHIFAVSCLRETPLI
jgi:hypothetical protein